MKASRAVAIAAAHNRAVPEIDLVTGAFGFTGSRIAERLLAAGREVRTLSRRRAGDHPLADRVDQRGRVADAGALGEALDGVETLYVTYWMRFPRGGVRWPDIVDDVRRLVDAAAAAGVRRLVYISVSNASHTASTAYFRAKAQAEEAIRGAGLSYAIVRPTLLYGEGDILVNNMAWTLRRLPVFGVPGDGSYRVQPVYVEDVADLVVRLGSGDEQAEVDAAGPETLSFDAFVRLVATALGRRARLVHLPPALILGSARLIGFAVRDVVLTRDEIRELMESLLVSSDPPTCPTSFSDWVQRRGAELGRRWSSELARNFRLTASA
ncbi:MAG TPA: NAD(P)H-binding protein [Candidatus Limnocylindria bacterium]|nr:NAD(P)H-binding protein [Candidatus Limnocylindria bacterium]